MDVIIKSKWKTEEDLEEFRFHDFSYVLFKNNEKFYTEYLTNYRQENNINKSNLVNSESSLNISDKNKKIAKSTVCVLL
jgi:hypothetical protein